MNQLKIREIPRIKPHQETKKAVKKYQMKTHGVIINVVVGIRSCFTIFVKLRNFERDGDLYRYTQKLD